MIQLPLVAFFRMGACEKIANLYRLAGVGKAGVGKMIGEKMLCARISARSF